MLGYPIIVFTDHKNNTFNGLKASDRVLRWLLLLEEYGVSFEYLPGKKNVVADALSRLDIDELKIHQEEVLALLSESEFSNIKFPMHTALIFKEQMKVQGLREKGLSQPHYSMKHIEGYEIVQANSKTATSIQDLFHNTWLARYPHPQFIVFDNGGEFKREFKQMCDTYALKPSQQQVTIHKQMQSLSVYTKL